MERKSNETETMHCLECGSPMNGRKDKKFCSDACRSRFHNRIHNGSRSIIRRTLSAMDRNHGILDRMLALGCQSADMDNLISAGFRPEYITGLRKSRAGHMECRCFDIKYCITERKIFNISKIDLSELDF